MSKQDDENEEEKSADSGEKEDSIEMPRSHSLPNMAWTEDPGTGSRDSLFESDGDPAERKDKPDGSW